MVSSSQDQSIDIFLLGTTFLLFENQAKKNLVFQWHNFSRKKKQDQNITKSGAGWTEALQLMPVGSTWELYIPANLAYGSAGAPPMIGPNQTLIFKVKLISIDKG